MNVCTREAQRRTGGGRACVLYGKTNKGALAGGAYSELYLARTANVDIL